MPIAMAMAMAMAMASAVALFVDDQHIKTHQQTIGTGGRNY